MTRPIRVNRPALTEKEPRLSLGMLPLARRDVERLRQILGLQRRLLDHELSPRARRALMHRGPFREALTWLEIHGQAPEAARALARVHRSRGETSSEQDGAERGRPRADDAGAGVDGDRSGRLTKSSRACARTPA